MNSVEDMLWRSAEAGEHDGRVAPQESLVTASLYTQQCSQGVEKAEAGLTWTWGSKVKDMKDFKARREQKRWKPEAEMIRPG